VHFRTNTCRPATENLARPKCPSPGRVALRNDEAAYGRRRGREARPEGGNLRPGDRRGKEVVVSRTLDRVRLERGARPRGSGESGFEQLKRESVGTLGAGRCSSRCGGRAGMLAEYEFWCIQARAPTGRTLFAGYRACRLEAREPVEFGGGGGDAVTSREGSPYLGLLARVRSLMEQLGPGRHRFGVVIVATIGSGRGRPPRGCGPTNSISKLNFPTGPAKMPDLVHDCCAFV